MLRTFALAALLVVMALPAMAGFEEGLAAYDRGDYRTALREWKPLAEKGIARAQYNLALMYNNGQGVPKNYALARKWFTKAALQGHAGAQNNLGLMYVIGRGVPKNYALAYLWWSLSAARGNKVAAKNLKIVEKRMTRAQVAKAQALVAKWRPTK